MLVNSTDAATATIIGSAGNLQMTNNNSNQIFSMENVGSNFADSTILEQHQVECVMPGLYLSKNFTAWCENKLHTHGFTHIIIIDKHIQELYYPNQQTNIFKQYSTEKTDLNEAATATAALNNNSDFKIYGPTIVQQQPTPPPPSYQQESQHTTNSTSAIANNAALKFGKDFNVLNLNFGEKSYLTTVLPNCYKAVKFINKALQSGGTILVIDCNGGEQKCLTIIVAYLMYKNNISFR